MGENADTSHGFLSAKRHYPGRWRTKSTSLPTTACKPSGPAVEVFNTEKIKLFFILNFNISTEVLPGNREMSCKPLLGESGSWFYLF